MKPTIQMPNPCHEDWEQMTPEAKGRHCAVCNTKVMDFTQSTHDDVVDYLQNHGGVCASVPVALLTQTGQSQVPKILQSVAITALSTLAIGVASPAKAQLPNQQSHTAAIDHATQHTIPKKPKYIKGRVHWPHDSTQGVQNVQVQIEGTSYCTLTNDKGEFVLAVDRSTYKNGASVVLRKGRYTPQKVVLDKVNQAAVISFDADMRSFPLGKVRLVDFNCQGQEIKPQS